MKNIVSLSFNSKPSFRILSREIAELQPKFHVQRFLFSQMEGCAPVIQALGGLWQEDKASLCCVVRPCLKNRQTEECKAGLEPLPRSHEALGLIFSTWQTRFCGARL